MEMEELETVKHSSGFKPTSNTKDLGRVETEFALLARGGSKVTRVFGAELCPHPNQGSDAELSGQLNHQIELFFKLQNNYTVKLEPASNEGQGDILCILEPVADQQSIWTPLGEAAHGEEELGFRPCFQSEVERGSDLDDIFNNEAILVGFDRVDALVVRLIALAVDSVLKGGLEGFQPVLENIRESNDKRKLEAQSARGFGIGSFLDDLQEIDLLVWQGAGSVRTYTDVTGGVGVEVGLAPPVNPVELRGKRRRPRHGITLGGGGER